MSQSVWSGAFWPRAVDELLCFIHARPSHVTRTTEVELSSRPVCWFVLDRGTALYRYKLKSEEGRWAGA